MMDGVQVTTNRFAGMADGLNNFDQRPQPGQPAQPAGNGIATKNASPIASNVTTPRNVEAAATFSAQLKRLEASYQAQTARMAAQNRAHARHLAKFETRNRKNDIQFAEKFAKFFSSVNQELLPKELTDRIDKLGLNPFDDWQKLEGILKDFVKHTNDPQARLLRLQLYVNKATAAIELTTKLVEHGTSGIKTILQTQT